MDGAAGADVADHADAGAAAALGDRGDRAAAILALIGVINLPIIKFSVDWWNTLHQPASIFRAAGPTVDDSMLWPLLIMAAAYLLFFVAVLLMRKHPNLSYLTSRLLPSEIPAEIVAFANEDGAHQVLFASGRPTERVFKELPEIGFARHVWPRFLRDNAARVFKL